jgi:hypothetical protein
MQILHSYAAVCYDSSITRDVMRTLFKQSQSNHNLLTWLERGVLTRGRLDGYPLRETRSGSCATFHPTHRDQEGLSGCGAHLLVLRAQGMPMALTARRCA